MKKVLLSFVLLVCALSVQAQFSLCGTVKISGGNPGNALVSLLGTKDSIYTDASGGFCFSALAAGTYLIQADYNNRKSAVLRLAVAGDVANIVLNIIPLSLDTLQVAAPDDLSLREDHSVKAEILDLNRHAASSVSVEQLMNRTAGVRIRNSGGLGAATDVVVGGFTGESVKFLIDGIPVDYLGSSMGITKIPSDIADHIEIYKGVMPTEIGIDALGGAINIVTKAPQKTVRSVSYETGSFQTHRLSLSAFTRRSAKLSFGMTGFMNYSANDFEVNDLPLPDSRTGRTRFIKARLFHNTYRQYSGEVYLNIENRPWADLFKIKLNSFALRKDIQNDFASRSRPFGGVFRKEHAYAIPSLQYEKSFFDKKLKVSQFLVYSGIGNQLTDSVKNARYDWLGTRHEASSGSEMGTDLSNLERPVIETKTDNLTYRGLFFYRVKEDQKLILNVVNNYLSRVADDLGEYHAKTHTRYNRFIAGLGYQYHFLHHRMEALSQLKYLSSQTWGEVNNRTGEAEKQVHNQGWSFAQSFKYRSYTGWLIRTSAENTYRLPDKTEIFGDNVFVLPNLSLRPERSFNVNFGVRYKKNEQYSVEVNTYMRRIEDMIRLKEITQFQANYLNLDKVRGYGVELSGTAYLFKPWEVSGNLTYNDFRFKGSNEHISGNDHFMDARVSNMPYYFGNADISYRFDRLLGTKDNLKLYWAYTYVHQFYLDFMEKQYEPNGFLGLFGKSKIYTDRIIPVQQVHSFGFIWSFVPQKEKAISLSAECNNLLDKPVFNNFKMQSAGRNMSVKITCTF